MSEHMTKKTSESKPTKKQKANGEWSKLLKSTLKLNLADMNEDKQYNRVKNQKKSRISQPPFWDSNPMVNGGINLEENFLEAIRKN